jgi:hypothetical protein
MLTFAPVVDRGPAHHGRLALLFELADELVRSELRSLQQRSEHASEVG